MKDIALNALDFTWKTAWVIMIAPFIIPAFVIVRLLGGNPFSMDDIGISFMFMCAIAIGIAVAVAAFSIGYFL